MRHFSEVPRESPPLGLKSKCSTAEARRSRALAESTAMPVQEASFIKVLSGKFRLRKNNILFFFLGKKKKIVYFLRSTSFVS